MLLSDVMLQFSLYIVPALCSFSKYLGAICVIPQVRSTARTLKRALNVAACELEIFTWLRA